MEETKRNKNRTNKEENVERERHLKSHQRSPKRDQRKHPDVPVRNKIDLIII
jgi:hypothetical protein